MSSTYKAIEFKKGGGSARETLQVIDVDRQEPGPGDLLVKIKANAVNPVDTKIRSGAIPAHNVTGYDAAGIVEAVGSDVKGFKNGDEVYYMGVLKRAGTMAEYHLIDHRLVAHKPKSLSWVDAAGVPLVALTAWELLVEGFGLEEGRDYSGKTIVIVNGAGGVGSIATQLAAKVFKISNIVVTASRQETEEHARKMGATHVISHRQDLAPQIKSKVGVEHCDYFMICHSTPAYMESAVSLCGPGGKIGSIVEAGDKKLPAIHAMDAFFKSLSFRWEMVLGKAFFDHDVASQGQYLTRIAQLYDEGKLTTLVTEHHPFSLESVIEAHERLESGKAIGKIAFSVDGPVA
ncbi:hypothetical protein PYCC9005_000185 [Savitreella phatthalungensis]